MVCRKPTSKHCRAQTNVHNSCVPRTWRPSSQQSNHALSSSWNRNQVPVFREPQNQNRENVLEKSEHTRTNTTGKRPLQHRCVWCETARLDEFRVTYTYVYIYLTINKPTQKQGALKYIYISFPRLGHKHIIQVYNFSAIVSKSHNQIRIKKHIHYT